MIAKQRKNRKMLSDLAIYFFFFIFFGSFFPLLEDVDRKLRVELLNRSKTPRPTKWKERTLVIIG
jgi:hypothetical protein